MSAETPMSHRYTTIETRVPVVAGSSRRTDHIRDRMKQLNYYANLGCRLVHTHVMTVDDTDEQAAFFVDTMELDISDRQP